MLMQYLSKLRPYSKDGPNTISGSTVQRISRKIIGITPILSIFVLAGMMAYSTIVIGSGSVDGEVYAADENVTPISSLIIDNSTSNVSTPTVRNNVAYSSHSVRVQASNIGSYALTITGPTNLTGTTTIGGAGGKKGSAMDDNTWGYGWADTTTANANITYNSFETGVAKILINGNTSSVDITKKLVFAAKFNQNAAEGHYTANVKLNLTLSPYAITAYKITFDCNGGTGCPTDAGASTNTGSRTYTIPNITPTRRDDRCDVWEFKEYSSSANSSRYNPGNTVTQNPTTANLTLKAEWTCRVGTTGWLKPTIVSFSASDGTIIPSNDLKIYSIQEASALPAADAAILTFAVEAVTSAASIPEFIESVGITDAVQSVIDEMNLTSNIPIYVEDLKAAAIFSVISNGSAAQVIENGGSVELALDVEDIADGDTAVVCIFNGADWTVAPATVKGGHVVGTYTELGAVVILKADI